MGGIPPKKSSRATLTPFLLMGKDFRYARYVEAPFWPSFTIHLIILKYLPFIVLFFRTLLSSLFVAVTEEMSCACVTFASAENRDKRVHTLSNITNTA